MAEIFSSIECEPIENEEWKEGFNFIKGFAVANDMRNTLIALSVAQKYHDGQFRKGGSPYIVHPISITEFLIRLNIKHDIYRMYDKKFQDKDLVSSKSLLEFDILCASTLLHDVIEDCKLPNNGEEFVTEYGLHPDVLKYVRIVTKFKDDENFSEDTYYLEISKHWQTLLLKIGDRTNNCSTMESFSKERMTKYVYETKKYIYSLTTTCKNYYPDFSHAVTIMKYLIVSICESVASVLNLTDIITVSNYKSTLSFIKGFAKGKENMNNTLIALSLAQKYYDGLQRKSGDPFIIHPLRVCSYLISLKISDDEICAAALLHEITKKCNLPNGGEEIVTEYKISESVLNLIHLVANVDNLPSYDYYERFKSNPKALLLKLSNRAHTCTSLVNSYPEEIKDYVQETQKYIYPLCDYAIKYFPEYSDIVELMLYHISSVCNMVQHLEFDD